MADAAALGLLPASSRNSVHGPWLACNHSRAVAKDLLVPAIQRRCPAERLIQRPWPLAPRAKRATPLLY
jgi:hypothetical protein